MKINLFTQSREDTFLRRMSGVAKLVCFLLLTFTVMLSYDIRVIAFTIILSFVMFHISKVTWRQIRVIACILLLFLLLNALFTFLLAPEQGVKIYGSRHEIFHIAGRYTLTQEQLLYMSSKLLKYVAVAPLGLIFFLCTDPSELAASLNGIGMPYKGAYAVSLTLRYFPDLQRDYNNISMSQQARGLEMSKKAGFASRVKNALAIIVPLIFSTLERIEVISNAMDLRAFGKHKKRTWYSARKISRQDILAIAVTALIFAVSLYITFFINHSRFYDPFA
ncbi:MAG: energy-coupling factor transporter transmembrane protein EcfT [Clostridiales Family XIII bacterium]|nr:energy-coupling factor transporter transmembrane protein EcfT [Clostridiales Family XIII bacterium]